jgi:hypothetical protein
VRQRASPTRGKLVAATRDSVATAVRTAALRAQHGRPQRAVSERPLQVVHSRNCAPRAGTVTTGNIKPTQSLCVQSSRDGYNRISRSFTIRKGLLGTQRCGACGRVELTPRLDRVCARTRALLERKNHAPSAYESCRSAAQYTKLRLLDAALRMRNDSYVRAKEYMTHK